MILSELTEKYKQKLPGKHNTSQFKSFRVCLLNVRSFIDTCKVTENKEMKPQGENACNKWILLLTFCIML